MHHLLPIKYNITLMKLPLQLCITINAYDASKLFKVEQEIQINNKV